MDTSVGVAIVTSVATGASTAGVAIVALLVNNKRFDLIERRLDKIEMALEMLTGSLHALDTRLSVIEDRILRRE